MSKEIRKLWFRSNAITTLGDVVEDLATLQSLMRGSNGGAAPTALRSRVRRLQGQVDKALEAVRAVPITESEKLQATANRLARKRGKA